MAWDHGRMLAEFEAYSVAVDAALEGREDAAAEIARGLIEAWRERWPNRRPPTDLSYLNGMFKRLYGPRDVQATMLGLQGYLDGYDEHLETFRREYLCRWDDEPGFQELRIQGPGGSCVVVPDPTVLADRLVTGEGYAATTFEFPEPTAAAFSRILSRILENTGRGVRRACVHPSAYAALLDEARYLNVARAVLRSPEHPSPQDPTPLPGPEET